MTKICIDGFNLALPKGTGIATYGRNLLSNLKSLNYETQALYGPALKTSANNIVNETALTDAPRPPSKLNRKAKVQRMMRTYTSRFGHTAYPVKPSGEVIWPGGNRPAADSFWVANSLYELAHRGFRTYGKPSPVSFSEQSGSTKPDLMHWTCPLPTYAKGVPNIYTFHDLIPLRLPHATMDDKDVFMSQCQEVVKRADHIAVVSETTKQDLIRILNVPEERITNTYQAVDLPKSLTQRPQEDVETELEGIFRLGWKNYFLHFGAIEPKKNLGRVVEAYLASGSQTPLVLIGGNGWLEAGEVALLNQVKRDGGPSAERIRQYEYMPFSLLVSLIRGAKATLFPSLYEGFGLPVLESMALGTAVLTSTGGSLPEVAGDAAIMVDPYDVRAMTAGIRTLDADDAVREDLQARGLIQSNRFSVDAYQQALAGMYTKLGFSAS